MKNNNDRLEIGMAVQTWGKQLTAVAAALALLGLPSAALAIISVDATFSDGALPSDFGFAPAGTDDPVVNVNTNTGVWNNNVPATLLSYWTGGTGAVATITGPTIYGRGFITVSSFSSADDDHTLVGLGRDVNNSSQNLGFIAYFKDGIYRLNNGAGTTDIPVANSNGVHIYGWELDITSRIIKLFFDDEQVGSLGGYSVGNDTFTGAPNASDDSFFYLGDATGGNAHFDIWDRWLVQEGVYVPEPSTVALLGVGGLLLLRRRMQR